MKSDKHEAPKKRFFERLDLKFSSDPDAECNRDSLAKLAKYVQSKRGAK